ncbi:thioredoxin domain-containing protein [Mangrovibrevibacter kandeliae]|uniref:SCO family protein n=1 Tax=Mangrovibrevibacter kandeliae TaxID=2968473 RepID=UPI002117F1B6|nr:MULTISPECIES: SCO family protein [unclassified Aurantimonas]MCQ8783991.1 SCO family protein [Aurantimonas sp. CSK15Z-1]MCW4116708.1 SCO family protein [Aurantimonas sp. MSK8Z-1]
MRRLALAAAFLTLASGAARATLAPADLAAVALSPPPAAALPPATIVRTTAGQDLPLADVLRRHPANLVLFVDYTCNSVCGAALSIAASSLRTPEVADLDAGLVVIGLDPKDGPEAARAMADAALPPDPGLRRSIAFLSADPAAVATLTDAVGYRYAYDPQTDQFAHPSGVLATDGGGRVARVLSSLSLAPEPLRLALVDAGKGKVGTLLDQIVLRCYAFDPAAGVYTSRIWTIMQVLGTGFTLAAGALILLLLRRSPRRAGGPA